MLKIAISSCFMYPDPSRSVFGHKTLSYVESDMFNYVSQKGILPILVPNVDDKRMQDLVDEVDGFVFQGGSDLAPQSYGEQPIENDRWKGDAVRDAYELRLFKMAFDSGKPILGICRGMQLMNVFFGGSLYQDLETQHKEALEHRNAQLYDAVYHKVNFVPGGYLESIYGSIKNPQVNSVHHQAIKTLGNNLEIAARSAPDDIIEGIRYTGGDKGEIVAVQWHPEFSHTLQDTVIPAELIMNWFVKHVEDYKR